MTATTCRTHLRVPVGTTVTFLNPGAETFPNFPNQRPRCATRFFEGFFNHGRQHQLTSAATVRIRK